MSFDSLPCFLSVSIVCIPSWSQTVFSAWILSSSSLLPFLSLHFYALSTKVGGKCLPGEPEGQLPQAGLGMRPSDASWQNTSQRETPGLASTILWPCLVHSFFTGKNSQMKKAGNSDVSLGVGFEVFLSWGTICVSRVDQVQRQLWGVSSGRGYFNRDISES